jgi:hypothetical protein
MPTTLGGLHGSRTVGTTGFEVLVSPPPPFIWVGCPSCRLPQPSFQHSIQNRSRSGGLSWQVVSHYIFRTGNVLQIQDLKDLFQLACMEQMGSQLRVIAGAISLDLLDNELGVSFDEELSDPQ